MTARWSLVPAAALLAGLAISAAHPQEPPDAADRVEARVQVTLDGFREQFALPGATAAFVLPDGTVGTVASGLADVEAAVPMIPRSRMLAASIGKMFVAATVVALAREGALDLDAPLSERLGERDWFARLPNHGAVTVRHLLNHASGLPDHVHTGSFAAAVAQIWPTAESPMPPEDLVGFILDAPPLFATGEAWSYSDTNYILLGLVIETVTGRSYYDEVTDRFLRPLGLTQTGPSDRRHLPGLAAGYMAEDNPFGFPEKTIGADGRMVWHPGSEWTGGGLVSTSRDLAVWGWALFNGRAMEGDYLGDLLDAVPMGPDATDRSYGAGVAIDRTGPFGPAYGHAGWIPGYTSSLRYYPEHNIAIAFQINTDIGIVDPGSLVMQVMEEGLANAVLQAGTP